MKFSVFQVSPRKLALQEIRLPWIYIVLRIICPILGIVTLLDQLQVHLSDMVKMVNSNSLTINSSPLVESPFSEPGKFWYLIKQLLQEIAVGKLFSFAHIQVTSGRSRISVRGGGCVSQGSSLSNVPKTGDSPVFLYFSAPAWGRIYGYILSVLQQT